MPHDHADPAHDHDHHHGHGHGHDHGHGHAHHHHGENASEQRLRTALAVLFAFTVVEAVGGWRANSLALLAEAAHMLADCASLGLAIVAIRIGSRPASAEHTYGSRRYQTLAAYTNGLTLLALTAWVTFEAVQRLLAPPSVNGKLMLAIAAIGGVANLAAFLILAGASSLNERGARAHILSDLLGSVAAVAAAGVILATGWLPVDSLLSIAVAVLILKSGWALTRESAHVLLEGTPPGLDTTRMQQALMAVPGICGIHHLHAWSLTGEAPMVTLHAELDAGVDRQATLATLLRVLHDEFAVEHATVQLEDGACAAPAPDQCHPGDP